MLKANTKSITQLVIIVIVAFVTRTEAEDVGGLPSYTRNEDISTQSLPVTCENVWVSFNPSPLMPLGMMDMPISNHVFLPLGAAILKNPVDITGDGVIDEVVIGAGYEPGGSYNLTSSELQVFELEMGGELDVISRARSIIEAINSGQKPTFNVLVSPVDRILRETARGGRLAGYTDTFIEIGSVQGERVIRVVSLAASETHRRPVDLRGCLENRPWDSYGAGFVIQALDVDRTEPWPNGPDCEEDQALSV